MNIFKKNPAVLLGLIVTVVFLAIGLTKVAFLDSLEYKFYDMRMNFRGDAEASDNIVIVDIDNDSIEKLGRWPWPRAMIAKGIDKIAKAAPSVIGVNVIFSEPQEDAAMKELNTLAELISEMAKTRRNKKLVEALERAKSKLNNDEKLAKSIEKSGNVVLPVFLKDALAKQELNPVLRRQALKVENPGGYATIGMNEIIMPISEFLDVSNGVGHVNLDYDVDGACRREPLLIEYQGLYIPSFTLKIATLHMNLPWKDVQAVLGSHVALGNLSVPMTDSGDYLVSFKGADAFKRYSFFDVINDKIPPELIRGKVVLISPSAAGIMNPIATPTEKAMPVGEFRANALWSILEQKHVQKPSWDFVAGLVMTIFVGVMITLVLPRLRAFHAVACFAVLLLALFGGAIFIFVSQGLWIRVTNPFLQLLIGYIGIVTLNFFVIETKKEKVEGESADTNRMLGLSFQSQGMLDMAFDKFRKVPVNDEMKEVLYNLALDYERKRQFNKAASVYEYIEEHDSAFKDVAQKKEKLLMASETLVYGDGFVGGGSTNDDGLLMTVSAGTRPTLGRYEVLKQLGKGAMGVVYLGQDPRINRTTAIKTFKFSNDFEPEEAEKMKVKFFREAESAGTLSHPNIVTIYDAGEEQDLAYIAMEYLEGEDLSGYTKRKKLLPMRKVLDYIADIADALNYAHKMGVVHRDIKPANIMLLKTGVVKVTDFGIARITATSQTQTGIVKGTPHYMSPEQISGKKVDGRSDIFSLGVMMFQMLTGKLPFKGDSPAALMHQIINKPHPDAKKYNPKLSKAHATIINKALVKDRTKRYQQASEMAAHLRKLGERIDALMAKKAAAE